jgi:hypothetical protein
VGVNVLTQTHAPIPITTGATTAANKAVLRI